MADFMIIEDEPDKPDDYELPPYGKPGRIFVEIVSVNAVDPNTQPSTYRYELTIIDYDGDSGVFWISEGIGFEYWFDTMCDEIEHPGFYVVEGVKGAYIRGEWGFTDDDEEWEYDHVRKATPDEILTEALQ